jgi:hypothetical protein
MRLGGTGRRKGAIATCGNHGGLGRPIIVAGDSLHRRLQGGGGEDPLDAAVDPCGCGHDVLERQGRGRRANERGRRPLVKSLFRWWLRRMVPLNCQIFLSYLNPRPICMGISPKQPMEIQLHFV